MEKDAPSLPGEYFALVSIDTRYLTPKMVDILHDYITLTEPMESVQLLVQSYQTIASNTDESCARNLDLFAMLIDMAIDLEKERFKIKKVRNSEAVPAEIPSEEAEPISPLPSLALSKTSKQK